MRVQITKMPLGKAAYGKQVDGSLSLKPGAFGGADYNTSDKNYRGVRNTVDEVSRDEANLEAEGGETAFGPITGQTIPDHLKITGKRHHQGGVPLNLPDDTFIFSDTASLRINEPSVLAMFNKTPKKGGYTPAELAKPYNINKYKGILMDPDSSKLERDTATIMIKNYIMKLGALALVQESMKGFPQGIPEMAKPYMEANGISEEDLMPELKEQADALEQAMASGQQTGMPQEQNPMAAQEMQQMAPEQAMQADQAMLEQSQGAPAYPEQMPSGAPVASPESMAQMQGSMPPPEMMPEQGMMAYGGIPYAAYGMEMGGFDFPYDPNQMAYGGVPKFDGTNNSQVNGGPGGPTTTTSSSYKRPITDVNTLQKHYNESKISKSPSGAYTRMDDYTAGTGYEEGNYKKLVVGRGRGNWNPTVQQAIDQYCKNMQNPKSPFHGVSAADVIASEGKYWTEQERADALIKLQGCERGGKTITTEYKKCPCLDKAGNPIPGKFAKLDENSNCLPETCEDQPKTCPCLDENGKEIAGKFAQQDENGNCLPETCKETESLICRCTDPVTGEVKEFPVEKMEECICQDGSRGETTGGFQDNPHWSRPARTNVMRNALMKTGVAPSQVVLPGRAQVEGAYEEYQTKVDTAQSAVNALQNAVMYGTAGSTASKQAQMKDLLGKSLRASMDAVANVQSRNVDRQRETNVQKATIDNSNIYARNQITNQGLALNKADADTETANWNKRTYNTLGAVMEADMDMAARQKRNMITPQFNEEYELGMVYPTGVQKPFTGAVDPTLEDRASHYSKRTGDYAQAWDMAYKEAMLNERRKKSLQHGGYVLANNVFPFII